MRDLERELCGIGCFGFPPLIFGQGADGLEGFDVERRIGRWWDGKKAESGWRLKAGGRRLEEFSEECLLAQSTQQPV